MRSIQRQGDVPNNFVETVTGETPNSVEVSLNAKGAAQVDLKLYYGSAESMTVDVAEDITTILSEVKRALTALGISLAGQEGK